MDKERIYRVIFGEFPCEWEQRRRNILPWEIKDCRMFVPVRQNRLGQYSAVAIWLWFLDSETMSSHYWWEWNLLFLPGLMFMFHINRARWEWRLFKDLAEAEAYKRRHPSMTRRPQP